MKTQNIQKPVVLALIAYAAMITGCSMVASGPGAASALTVTTVSGTTTTGGTTGATSFSTTVATADVIPGRIQAALTLPAGTTSLVSTLTGNFGTAITQQGPNLAIVTDPATATGASAVPLLAFAACNDVKPASYGVTTTGTIAAQTANIVAAGLTIVNQCTANLAAAGTSLNTSVSQAFTDLMSANNGTLPSDAASYSPPLVAASPVATTAQAFISVCTAATSFCVGMLTF